MNQSEIICPLCNQSADAIIKKHGDVYNINCQNCGNYLIDHGAIARIRSMSDQYKLEAQQAIKSVPVGQLVLVSQLIEASHSQVVLQLIDRERQCPSS